MFGYEFDRFDGHIDLSLLTGSTASARGFTIHTTSTYRGNGDPSSGHNFGILYSDAFAEQRVNKYRLIAMEILH
jgi:hypothetical protein